MIDHYKADVQTAQDYYPFGMIMPGRMFTALTVSGGSVTGTTQVNGFTVPVDLALTSRSGNEPTQYVASRIIDLDEGFESGTNDDVTAYLTDTSYAGSGNGGSGAEGVAGAGKYRYGFNGKENDNEVKGMGDQIDYGARIYDPGVGRFLSLDPLRKKYPWFTPYQFAGNSPIAKVDLDGRENYYFYFAWSAKIKGFNCISVTVQKNHGTFWDDVLDHSTENLTGSPIKGQHFFYQYGDHQFASYKEMLDYHKSNPESGLQNGKISDAQQALTATAFLAAGEIAAQSMENSMPGGSVNYSELAMDEGEVLSGEYSILKGSIKNEENSVLKSAEEQTAYIHNGSENAPKTTPEGTKPDLLGWEELQHRAIMSDNPLSVATSTNGTTFRAVVQNIEKEYGGNVWELMSDLNSQAQKAGASKLEVKGIAITNSDFNKIFQKANGKTLMGYDVQYSRKGSYGKVILTKDLKAKIIMSKFREYHQVKSRLLAHYKNIDADIFPIQASLSIREIDLLTKAMALQSGEFLINEYNLTHSFKLYLTSLRLILKRDDIVFNVHHEDVAGVFLKFPFKKEEPPHELSLITINDILYVINFFDLTGLVEARNEIYRVINTILIDWQGKDFNVDKELGDHIVINLPVFLNG